MQAQEAQQTVDGFLEDLLNEKGITDLEPEVKAQLISDMRETLLRQINKEAILHLTDEKAEELSNRLDTDPNFDGDQMAQFLRDAGVNLTEVALDTMLKFRNFYLEPGE